MIRRLDRVIPPGGQPPTGADESHPMRVVTRQVAFDPDGWTPDRAAKVAELFDGLAADWHTRTTPERQAVLVDALDRGEIDDLLDGVCIEIGSGTGDNTPRLTGRFRSVVAVDLSIEMLRLAPAALAPRAQADAARLPLPDASCHAVVLVNALLFPTEVDRVLRPGGAVIWVNSSGDQTPIHLPAADVAAALPGDWSGVESEAAWGTWTVLRRRT